MKRIDLNVDIGEGFPHDLELLDVATSANVCCGVHAGSLEESIRIAHVCAMKGVSIGAHPGSLDRATMGRGPVGAVTPELIESVRAQCVSLLSAGARYVKLHGAIYNQSANDEQFAYGMAAALRGLELDFLGLPRTHHESIAERLGVRFIREGFADRAYLPGGTLVPRSQPGSLLQEPAEVAAQALALAGSVDSICLHGDTPGSAALASAVRDALEREGYTVRAWE